LVACCGGAFYLIGEDSFKDNSSLFQAAGAPTAFDFLFAGLVVMMDTGSMIQGQSELGRTTCFVFGSLGFVMLAVILALIVEYIHAWMDKIKKGRTNVVEKDHIVILGWTDVCFALVRELDLSTDDGLNIVVLCPHDRKELNHRVNDDLPKSSKSKIIVRNGFPGNVS
jgi:hypothetical protein